MKLPQTYMIVIAIILVYFFVLRFDPVAAAAREYDYLNGSHSRVETKFEKFTWITWSGVFLTVVKPNAECPEHLPNKLYTGKYIDLCGDTDNPIDNPAD